MNVDWRKAIGALAALAVLSWCSSAYAQQDESSAVDESAGEESAVDNTSSLEAAERAARQSSEARRQPRGHTVAVIALGDGSKTGPVIETLLSLLDARGFDVLSQETLRRRIDASLVSKPPSEVANRFVDLTPRIARGIEKFFYKGNEAALESLTPAVNLGMAHLDVLARRPDFASQVYEAGIVMIRAYRNVDKEDDARRLARGLTAAFPGFNPAGDSAPPPVVELLESEHEALADQKTRLKIAMLDAADCKALVNGTPVGGGSFAVSPEKRYFVTMECGAGTAPLWVVRPERGATVEVPISAGDALDYRMDGVGFHQRKRAEGYLRLVSFWGQVPRLIGVAEADSEESSESFVLVHMGADGSTGWSDRADESTVSRMLERVMPDFDAERELAGGDAAGASDAGGDWLGWTLVGGGAALAVAGSWGLIAANGRATQLACSPASSEQPSASHCSDVEPLHFDSSEQFDEARSQVSTVRWLGGGGLVAGLGLAGWGVYRLITAEQRSPASARLNYDLEFSPHHARVIATLWF